MTTMTTAETARLRKAMRCMSEAAVALSAAIELELSGHGGDVAGAYRELGDAQSNYLCARSATTPASRELEQFEVELRGGNP